VEGLELPAEISEPLLRADGLVEMCEALPLGLARIAHACTHTTFAPTIMRAGSKINVIPDSVELEIDIRTLPGHGADEVRAMLDEALGDLATEVEIVKLADDPATESPVDTPLWDVLQRTTREVYADSTLMPMLMVAATDARFFRRVGATAYGFGLFSTNLTYEDFATMFHGDNERVDVESLRLSTDLWEAVSRDLLG
jgi:acetylornithine deacetylase/succinyl-diaminopimelate desuccinylase-like protein